MNRKLFNRIAIVELTLDNQEVIRLSNLRISFNVQKTLTSESNSARVMISNLSEATRNRIKKTDTKLTLKIGYEEDTGEEIAFVGDVQYINHAIERPEILTTIEANDGEKNLRDTRVSLSYKAGTSLLQILQDILNKFNLKKKVNVSILGIKDKKSVNGISVLGQAKSIIDQITKDLALEWSFQNDELKLTKTTSADFTRAIKITSSTGLIGSPERLNDTTIINSNAGWKIVSLLQPKAEPGGIVALQSREITQLTNFKIVEVSHDGDTHGQDWTTTLQVKEI